jgi:hypothetical protein
MGKYPDTESIQIACCEWLSYLSLSGLPTEDTPKMVTLCYDSILAAMQKFPHGVDIQKAAFAALLRFFTTENGGTTENAATAEEWDKFSDLLESVMAALGNHPSQIFLLEQVCAILFHLTFKSSQASNALANSGCIAAVVVLMERYPTEEKFHEHACSVFHMICGIVECRSTVVEEGGIQAILSSMNNHCESSSNIRFHGLAILCDLSEGCDDIKWVIAKGGGVAFALDALDDERSVAHGKKLLSLLADYMKSVST